MIKLLIVLILLYIFALRCRKGHPGLEALKGWSYAHRGLHSEGVPENSMAAFKAALDGGFGIEFDVHLLADGNLAVIHDSLLNRTTGQAGRIEDLTTEDLKKYPLEGTEETIPTFAQLLELYNGKAPLIVELKPVDGNHAQLTETACKMLDAYPGPYCLESFDTRCIQWLKKNRPNLIRGQLSYRYIGARVDMPDLLKFVLTHNLLNFTCVPDFVAYRYCDRKKTLSNDLCRKLWKAQGVSWTLKTKEEYDTAVSEGWLPIFEGFLP